MTSNEQVIFIFGMLAGACTISVIFVLLLKVLIKTVKPIIMKAAKRELSERKYND